MKKPFITQITLLLSIIFTMCFSFASHSQIEPQKQKSVFWQHVQFGGNIGLSFGQNFFSGSISPSAVYRFDEKFAAGTSIIFSYSKDKYYYESYIAGASILGLFNPIPQIQLSAEFEQLYVNQTDLNPICNGFTCYPLDQSYWYPGLYLGAGYSMGPVTMGIRFDVLYDEERSIYGNAYNPFVRVYF